MHARSRITTSSEEKNLYPSNIFEYEISSFCMLNFRKHPIMFFLFILAFLPQVISIAKEEISSRREDEGSLTQRGLNFFPFQRSYADRLPLSYSQEDKRKAAKKAEQKLCENVTPLTCMVVQTVFTRFNQSDTYLETIKVAESDAFSYEGLTIGQRKKLDRILKRGLCEGSESASGRADQRNLIDPFAQPAVQACQQLQSAYDYIKDKAISGKPISIPMLQEIHSILHGKDFEIPPVFLAKHRHLPCKPSGQLRTISLNSPLAMFIDEDELSTLLQSLIEFVNSPPMEMDFSVFEAIARGILLSIHPFLNGNGRLEMLFTIYLSILYNRIPLDYSDRELSKEHVIFSYLTPGGVAEFKNILKGVHEKTPALLGLKNLTPSIFFQARSDNPHLTPEEKLKYGKIQTKVGANILKRSALERQKTISQLTDSDEDLISARLLK